ncbi:YheC/YheD family protein [Neobacillus sp. SAB-20_R2A]|uniref:YheC/YheD family endospore coat-associated protein n=1 Tax=Neobacillus sp. SAB-20_R2A TaxID=3120519 RepID=UPI003C6E6C99
MDIEYVGICLPSKLYKRFPIFGIHKEENLELYEAGAKMYSINLCYFRWEDIQPGQTIIKAYVKYESGYQLCTLETPKVIFNRTMTSSLKVRRKIKALTSEGRQIFNSYIRDRKYFIHTILMKNPDLVPHLPETLIATNDSIHNMMKKYDELIIKPSNDYLGRGIMKLQKTCNNQWSLIYNTANETRKIDFEYEFPDVLLHSINSRAYLVQKRIPLDTHEGNPFDIRVHVQRDETGDWNITGMLVRVAPKHGFLTNVGQGGTSYTLEDIVDLAKRIEVQQAISSLSLKVAECLTGNLPHLADIGLDIGLTKEGSPYFIECNFRPHRYIFLGADMVDERQLTHTRPIGYARFLLDKK